MNKYNHTFFKFMHDLIDSGIWANLSATARTLYPVLCRFTNESFKAVWPGTDELLRLTGFKTKKSLQLAKKELVQAGLIDIVPGTGRTSTRYYFRFDYPNSAINIEEYRDKIVSPRRGEKYPPGEEKEEWQGEKKISPNNIHININTNYNKKQETLLENIEKLLNNFLKSTTNNKVDQQQIIQTMLDKYGQLEIGEAIKIAIQRGKNGDINYLEGILRNRAKSKDEKISSKQNDVLKMLFEQYPQYKDRIKSYYDYGDIHYLKSDIAVDRDSIQEVMKSKGYNIKILCPKSELTENFFVNSM